jgi:multimeric flavodoxin WrbA
MSKKVVILLGSPRKNGNSATLAAQVAEGARSAGAKVQSFFLQKMKIAPCNACEGCHKKNSKGCVIKDDMQRIYAALAEADAVVFATPIYWFTMSAQIKLAIDRCYALIGSEGFSLEEKRAALVMTYGAGDPVESGCVNAIRAFQDASRFTGIRIVGMVYGSAGAAGAIKANAALMKQARELGERLVN